jgi:membrane-associated phospholipid phosphatase
MERAKKLVRLNLLLIGLLLLSIAVIDKLLAAFVNTKLTSVQPFFYNFTLAADDVTNHSFYLLLLCSGLGLLFLFKRRTRKVAFVLLAIVFNVVVSLFVTNVMKFEFERARPDVYLISEGKTADFYSKETRDYSFPSAHTSFYLSLFLPGALVFKRFAPVLLFIPGVVIIGRVVQNEHYLSDVLCSIIIVFNLCAFILGLFYLLDNKLRVKEGKSKMKKETDTVALVK